MAISLPSFVTNNQFFRTGCMHALAERTSWLVCCHISRDVLLSLLATMLAKSVLGLGTGETYSLLSPANEDSVSIESKARIRHSNSHTFRTSVISLSLPSLHVSRNSLGNSPLANSSNQPGPESSLASLTGMGDLVLAISRPEMRSLKARAARNRFRSLNGLASKGVKTQRTGEHT